MAAEWYYKPATSKEVGPFTPADLKRLASEGRIAPGTLVRKGTEGRWVPAFKVKGLVNGEAERPTGIAPAKVVRSAPSVPVSREPEEEPGAYSPPRLPSKIREEEDAESSDDLPRNGVSPGILIGAGIGSLMVVGLIVLVVSLSGKSDSPSQNQTPKPATPSAADMERERQTRLTKEKQRAKEEEERKKGQALDEAKKVLLDSLD